MNKLHNNTLFNNHIYNSRTNIKPRTPYFMGAKYRDNTAVFDFAILGADKSKLSIKYIDHTILIHVPDVTDKTPFSHEKNTTEYMFNPRLDLIWHFGPDENNIQAKFENGILSVTFVPKDDKSIGKSIQIQ